MRRWVYVGSLLIFPFLVTALWGHLSCLGETIQSVMKDTSWITGQSQRMHANRIEESFTWYVRKIDQDEYIAKQLYFCTPDDTQEETMKALAVILRTNPNTACGSSMVNAVVDETEIDKQRMELCRRSAGETANLHLVYQKRPICALWTCVSNGSTRDGLENQLVDAPYLKPKSCKTDILSMDYLQTVTLKRDMYLRALQQIFGEQTVRMATVDSFGFPVLTCKADSTSYITDVMLGNKVVDGGSFAAYMGLHSPSFSIQYEEQQVTFLVQGKGHGFGMSLYEADRLSKEGKNFMEILQFFYPGTELAKR